ncbi:LytR/AlgR family response regulator transcription factor [Hyunsoonleella ulvae]|uniref:LytR/AlgR family response regulator transcription factor n=1 Tax=Hyunsoonleella ulvae TaxID=2799948 RepID=UPI00193930BE|nr:LytTR family DNA-binding domain-containing protein [Hyunsoonleella ulvae]
MLKVLIIEDESISSKYIISLLNKCFPDKFIIEKELDNIVETISWFKNNEIPDLIFMDIQLSDGVCFEIFKEVEIYCPIIFTTAYDAYAIKAFKTSGIDYLLKPITEKEFHRAVSKFFKMRELNMDLKHASNNIHKLNLDVAKVYKDRFLVKLGNKYTPIKIKDIAYFYKDDITFAKSFSGNVYPMNNSLSHIENSIDETLFFRANRTFLVNIDAIDYLSQYKPGQLTIKVKPKFDDLIVLSQERSSHLKSILN